MCLSLAKNLNLITLFFIPPLLKVRAAGFGIASALASTATGCVTLTTHCQHIPGGVWGAAFSILLDQSECSQARQAVALLLVNLTAHPMPSGSVATSADTWQGPIVQDQITQVCILNPFADGGYFG